MPTKRHTLLVVDDEPDSQKLFRLALKRHPLVREVKTFTEGQSALNYLQACTIGSDPACAYPALMFLDLKMPVLDGFQVLRHIRGEADLKRMPVIIFTTSQEETDIATSYDLGANSFIRKSVDFDVFCFQLEEIIQYWLGDNKLPF
jgi:two-component system response regulator